MADKKIEINREDINQLIENARFLKKQDAQQSLDFLNNAINLSKEAKFTKGIANGLKEFGSVYFLNNNYVQSLNSYQEAIAFFEQLNDQESKRSCYDEISDVYFKIGDYEQALESQLQALACSKDLKNNADIGIAYNKVGEIYKYHTEYRKAIEQHFNALKVFEELGDKRQLSNTNFYIGNCYNWVNELDVAKGYLEKSLELAEELGDPYLKVKPMGSLAILNTKLENYDKSLDFFIKGIENVNIIGNKFLKADLLKSLGNLFNEIQQHDKAINTLNEALQISEELNVKFPTNLIHQFLSDAYEKKGDYKKSLEHYRIYTSLCKEINNEQIALKTTGIQLKFDLEEIKKAKEIAEKSVQLKDQFLSNISHEVRTPMNGILGMVNLLSDTHLSPEQSEYLNTIKLSGNNLLAIINDIFDYSKIHSGKIEFNNHEFKIKELLTSAVQMIRAKADEKKLQLSLVFDDSTPDKLIGDPVRLNQLLLNLLNNAVKFTDTGSVTLEMQLLEEKQSEVKLLFKVSDTGIGIADERLPTIFESFTNINYDDKVSSQSTGLGLTIVKHLVEMQGGSISVNSTLNTGSVFKVELSFKVPAVTTRKGATPIKSSFELQDLSLVSLLLVEDNKVNQFLAKQLLTKMGFAVDIAGSGAAALEQLKKKTFDIILMDVQMPEMTGYELCEHIRKQLQPPVNQIPIVALTAYASAQEKEKAMNMGMNDYVTKPYSPQELLAVILKHVKRKPLPEKKIISDAPPVLDTLFSLMSNSKEDVISLIDMMLEQIPSINKKLEASIHDKKWEEAFQASHKVKSSVKILKIAKLNEVITKIEENTRSQSHIETLPQLFKTYQKLCNDYLEILKTEVVKLKGN